MSARAPLPGHCMPKEAWAADPQPLLYYPPAAFFIPSSSSSTLTSSLYVSVLAFFIPNMLLSSSYETMRIAFCGTTLMVLATHPR